MRFKRDITPGLVVPMPAAIGAGERAVTMATPDAGALSRRQAYADHWREAKASA